MGEVYKAKDTRLDRTVAIKVLPEHLAKEPERRERFEREARAVSSLNHPHICTLHDIGEQDGTDYLVMEYLEGETLADRLKKGALRLDQALHHAIEIADALDKAHRQGVVHRDLKPGNIMLTKAGAKLLDFGLAKMKASASGQDASVLSALPTEEKPLTEKGSILGTFQYMAPEHLEGKDADTRTDIFAFGTTLYEMVTGRKAFEGKSQASLIAAILERNPPLVSELQSLSPPTLDRVVSRCLAKDPDDRWQTARDLHEELSWIAEGGSQAGVLEGVGAAQPDFWKRALTVGLAVVVTAVVTGFAVWNLIARTPQVTRFAISLPATDRVNDWGIALSADGRDLVYIIVRDGVRRLYRRSMDQLVAVLLPGTEGAKFPFFSPDGEWVGFWADGKLKKVPLEGGPPLVLCDAGISWAEGCWGPNDTIIFDSDTPSGLMQVRAAGGEPRSITILDTDQGETDHWSPDILSGGKAALFVVVYGLTETARIAVQSLETGERKILMPGVAPRYSPTGHIVYAREDSLWAVPFDADRLEVAGSPVPLLEGIRVYRDALALFAIADNGSLVYGPSVEGERELLWVDRKGHTTALVQDRLDYQQLRLSPDGRRLAVSYESDIWIFDTERGTRARFTFEGDTGNPVWSPDGMYVTYSSYATNAIARKRADGTGEAETLLLNPYPAIPCSWSPDGNVLAFYAIEESAQRDIWFLPLEGDRTPISLIETPFDERLPSFSPDGRWVAYVSNESGRNEVYLQPYTAPRGKVVVSTDGGNQPVWCPEGGELFYSKGDQMVAVAVETAPTLDIGTPHVLFEGQFSGSYDVSPDCQRFVMKRELRGEAHRQLNVVLNWYEELKRLVPAEN
jgi:Tol biopolymer transport system component/predicted Ser/Thr protein kinase